ncbi:hypothetical protein [Modestobacter sp. VKM Ac-2985]|uniref:hypothetical protein n=1 Tax=Modestobacter sp. VKM Ac-2985 TaxID=3004139 RepID=UPI0022ABAD1B|nr:hypothetical protein [Modestobacter sp. VKM Ac-2985]MCZ2837092.1 hypothetical protein [Modestobacter sp. VKM Ac-2985]
MTADQGHARPWNLTRWVDVLPGHDLVLTRADVEGAPVGAVFSIEADFGSDGHPVPISVERRWDGTWTVHSRAYVPSDALVGGRATPRRRVFRETGEDASPVIEQAGDRDRVTFAEAAARMAKAQR